MAIRGGGNDTGFGPSIASQAYVPRLFAKKMERKLYATTIYQSIMNTKYEGQIKNVGDEIDIRMAPSVTINDYQVGQDNLTYGTPSTASKSLKITEGKMWTFKVDDIDKLQMDVPYMSELATSAAEEMKIVIDKDMLAFITDLTKIDAANQGLTAGAISNSVNLGAPSAAGANARGISGGSNGNAVDAIVEVNQVMDEQNIPSEGRWIVLPSWYIARLKTGDLKRADVTNDSTGVIRTGNIGMIDRTTVYQNNNLKSTLETAVTSFSIPFGINDAATFATQIVKSETLRLETQFADAMRGLCVYGREVIHGERMGVLYAKAA